VSRGEAGHLEDDPSRSRHGSVPGVSRLRSLARFGFRPSVARVVVVVVALGSIAWGVRPEPTDPAAGSAVVVSFVFSTDAEALLEEPIRIYNARRARVAGRIVRIQSHPLSSGRAETLIAEDLARKSSAVKPALWMPASSIWGQLLNTHAASLIVRSSPEASFIQSPHVIAIWDQVYQRLAGDLAWSDLFRFANSPADWTKASGGGFGPFRLAQSSPESSTSGLSVAISEYYAAAGKTEGLSDGDVRNPDVREKVRSLEDVLAHSGPTADDLLNAMACLGPGYATAVYIQETSLIRFNNNRKDGDESCVPRYHLRGIYPSDGTFEADYPLLVVDAPWVDKKTQMAAVAFAQWLKGWLEPEVAFKFGFRFDIRNLPARSPIDADHGADPAPPEVLLPVPDGLVLAQIQEQWLQDRRGADLSLVLDTSASTYESGSLPTAQRDFPACLDQLVEQDGMAVVSVGSSTPVVSAFSRISNGRDRLTRAVHELLPGEEGTALAKGILRGIDLIRSGAAAGRPNGVVVITDGIGVSDGDELRRLALRLRPRSRAEDQLPRVFALLFGTQAEPAVMTSLEQIAEVTGGAVFRSEETSFPEVCHEVVSNY
jgi:Ca-activated chloride channel family protein